ncbi:MULTISPECIES: hypothetical protein [Burkholderia cepacia complex]|uniref:hypothetical protein n=1 Tax=Burkholderia cepacia complex TaxID=87882 RepID=UPI0012BA9312|nr:MULTISPECIES: hypothetical protein [Burkholderia cepacia complex]
MLEAVIVVDLGRQAEVGRFPAVTTGGCRPQAALHMSRRSDVQTTASLRHLTELFNAKDKGACHFDFADHPALATIGSEMHYVQLPLSFASWCMMMRTLKKSDGRRRARSHLMMHRGKYAHNFEKSRRRTGARF